METAPRLTVYQHPLAHCRLTRLRDVATDTAEFRSLLRQLATLLVTPAFADLPIVETTVQTPLESGPGKAAGLPVVLVPILRAGLGLVDGMLELLPEAHVGHLGMYRDEATLQPVPYYAKLPAETTGGYVVVCDPMLATGHSAAHAIDEIIPLAPGQVVLATILASPAGIAEVHRKHPGVHIVTLAVDRALDERGYIVPGLGDAGDRYFGT